MEVRYDVNSIEVVSHVETRQRIFRFKRGYFKVGSWTVHSLALEHP